MSVLVGRKAPDFDVPAVLGNGEITDSYKFSQAAKGKYAVLFFYPLDFTFVCPTELIALDKRMSKFRDLGVEVVSLSVDSQFTHSAWRKTPVDKGGIGEVSYVMAADVSHGIARDYGVELEAGTVAYRATFLIDQQGMVRHQLVNDLPLGRNIDEILRTVEALQFHEQHGEVCPAGWQKGQSGMKADTAGVAEYLSEHSNAL